MVRLKEEEEKRDPSKNPKLEITFLTCISKVIINGKC